MATVLRALGMLSWIGCALTLTFQSLSWIFTGNWRSLPLLDISSTFLGVDFLSIIHSLPLEMAVKAIYLLSTTELAVIFWWAGIFFFIVTLLWKVLLKK